MKVIHQILLMCVLVISANSCSDNDSNFSCNDPLNIQGTKSICLLFVDGDLDGSVSTKIEILVSEGMTQVQDIMPIDDLLIQIIVDPSRVIPEIGIGGFNPNSNEVRIYINPDFNNLEASLDAEFIPMLAHEVHHALRRRSVGYGSTLFEAIISEGLADHFSVEMTGVEIPRWSHALDSLQLIEMMAEAEAIWHESPYDHNAWFFGNETIPRWTGYSLGYELVKQYKNNNPGSLASMLHNESAESFIQ